MEKIDNVPVVVDIEAIDDTSVYAPPFARGIPVAMGTHEQDVEEMDYMKPAATIASSTLDPEKTEDNDDVSGPKQGRLFCYCCCDMRRATIIINIILIVITIISMAVIVGNENSDYNDDSVYSQPLTVSTIVVGLFSIGFSIVALIGAIKFNAWLVLLNAIWLVIGLVVSTSFYVQANTSTGFVVVNFLVTCFFMYPHLMLIYELKASKTMSRSTYAREKKTCC